MRPVLVALFATFAIPWNSVAQVPSITEGNTFEAGKSQWHRVIKNQSASSLVAYWAPFQCPKRGPVAVADALLYTGNHDIHPGQSLEIVAGDPSRCSGTVSASIFSDGHAEGDPQALDELYSRRRDAYKALGESIQLLDAIQNEHAPMQRVIETISARHQASLRDGAKGGPGYEYVYSFVLNTLTDPRWDYPRLPSDNGRTDKQQKLSAIEDVMNANGLSHDEARIMVFTKRLKEWKSLLEGNLQPPR